jgi:hypothetical protein
MYCSQCGRKIDAEAAYCPHCGRPVGSLAGPGVPAQTPPSAPAARAQGNVPRIPSHLTEAILVTIFCCMPFGIVAIVYAAQVNGRLEAGDVAGARSASRTAGNWCWASFWSAVALGVIWGFFALIGIANS